MRVLGIVLWWLVVVFRFWFLLGFLFYWGILRLDIVRMGLRRI